jgi:uncharacterized iron-regulated membrane protein
MKLPHKIIFWTHLLAGLVIFITSFTGVILMYEPQVTEYSEWNQRWMTPPGSEAKRLALDDLVAKVLAGNPEGRPAAITVKSDPAASVIVNLGRENTIFVNLIPVTSWVVFPQPITSCTKSSIGHSPAHATWRFSGSPSPESISGGRIVGNGAV